MSYNNSLSCASSSLSLIRFVFVWASALIIINDRLFVISSKVLLVMHQIVMHIGVAQLYDFGVTLQCASSYIYFQPLDALHDYDLFVTFILQLVEAILLCSTCSCISYWWLHLLDFIGYAMIYRWLL